MVKKIKKPKKITKASEEKKRKSLAKKCLKLWSKAVRLRAGNKCKFCGSSMFLNAHHLEEKTGSKALKLDLRNGIALCAKHHKFDNKDSAHKSFCFTLALLDQDTIDYLKQHRKDEVEFTYEYLTAKCAELTSIINSIRKDQDGTGTASPATEANDKATS